MMKSRPMRAALWFVFTLVLASSSSSPGLHFVFTNGSCITDRCGRHRRHIHLLSILEEAQSNTSPLHSLPHFTGRKNYRLASGCHGFLESKRLTTSWVLDLDILDERPKYSATARESTFHSGASVGFQTAPTCLFYGLWRFTNYG